MADQSEWVKGLDKDAFVQEVAASVSCFLRDPTLIFWLTHLAEMLAIKRRDEKIPAKEFNPYDIRSQSQKCFFLGFVSIFVSSQI